MLNIFSALKNNRDIFLVVLILFVLMMMILPMPHEVMDVIIAFNISITVIVLMVVLYMKSPLSLSSFPSILLVLALLRIGITISTSRLILLSADAGDIVRTFGEFVVGGNLVVGIIIFMSITIINFIVITKGSERVAEVSARFSLDAMPGKQMSIDADMRAGTITQEDANVRRENLGLESKLYGAMDGAMKFVKGDSIASMIDIFINLVGGLIVGILQHQMAFGDALKTYSILTVGDGLVQQIPQLLISLSAGMMITRVSRDGDNKNMGQMILTQILEDYKVLFSASALLLIFALIPGMPTFTFLTIFSIVVGIGYASKKTLLKQAAAGPGDSSAATVDVSGDVDVKDPKFIPWKVLPIELYLAQNLKGTEYVSMIKKNIAKVQQNILFNLGVDTPQITLRYVDKLPDYSYEILIDEIPISKAVLHPSNILVLVADHKLMAALDDPNYVENLTEFGFYTKGVWSSDSNSTDCSSFGLSFLTIDEFIFEHIKHCMQQSITNFLGIQEVKNLLDKMTEYQDLVRELLRLISLNQLTDILKYLVAEAISIRNFKKILDSLLEWAQREKEVILLYSYVRKDLGKYIAYKFSQGTYVISCLILSMDIENLIRDSIRYTNFGSYLSMDPALTYKIEEQIASMLTEKTKLTIVTHIDIRYYVYTITRTRFPTLPILAHEEIADLVKLHNFGVIELEE